MSTVPIVRIRKRMTFANEAKRGPVDPERMASFWHDSKMRTEGSLHWVHLGLGFYRVTASEEDSMGNFIRYVDPNVVYPKKPDEPRPPARVTKQRWAQVWYALQPYVVASLMLGMLGAMTGLASCSR